MRAAEDVQRQIAIALVTLLARRLHALAPRSVLEKFAVMQMIDAHLPTTDSRELMLTRYTQPEAELSLESAETGSARATFPRFAQTVGGRFLMGEGFHGGGFHGGDFGREALVTGASEGAEDIFGDRVNVAVRLEALAQPDAMCLSRIVRDQVRDRLDYGL
jgi:hypothetical protein